MTEQLKKILVILSIVLSLVCGGIVVSYYWSTDEFYDIRNVSIVALSALVIYVVLQLVKRFLTKEMESYQWLYYIGLAAVVIPVFLKTSESQLLHTLTDYGTLFLLVPPLIDGYKLVKK